MAFSTATATASIMSPMPIRVHTGVQRRGRKLADWKQSLINQAVREIRQRERKGESVSVREIAQKYCVSKSTLHRYLRSAPAAPSSCPRPKKLGIDFLISKEVAPVGSSSRI